MNWQFWISLVLFCLFMWFVLEGYSFKDLIKRGVLIRNLCEVWE